MIVVRWVIYGEADVVYPGKVSPGLSYSVNDGAGLIYISYLSRYHIGHPIAHYHLLLRVPIPLRHPVNTEILGLDILLGYPVSSQGGHHLIHCFRRLGLSLSYTGLLSFDTQPQGGDIRYRRYLALAADPNPLLLITYAYSFYISQSSSAGAAASQTDYGQYHYQSCSQ